MHMNHSYIYSNVIAFTREYTYCIQYTCNLLIVFHFNFALMAGFFYNMHTQTNDGAYIYVIKVICEYLKFSLSKKILNSDLDNI